MEIAEHVRTFYPNKAESERLEKFLQLSFIREIYEYLFSGPLPPMRTVTVTRRLRRHTCLTLLEFCPLL